MKRFLTAASLIVAVFAIVVATVGALDLGAAPAVAAPACRCPLIVDQVICSNGKTYINQCFANCAHAKDCVRIGP